MIVTCPRCFTFDDVLTPRRLPDGRTAYTCTGEHDGAGPHTWSTVPAVTPAPAARASPGRGSGTRVPRASRTGPNTDDAVDELLAPLLSCVVGGEPFVEYGVVEYRFRLARPDLFVEHVRERGHLMLGARRGQASASTRFVKALGQLASSGDLEMVKGPGTGAWRHDPSLSYWARPPRPTGPLLTWSMYCATQGRSAEWTDDDRALFDR